MLLKLDLHQTSNKKEEYNNILSNISKLILSQSLKLKSLEDKNNNLSQQIQLLQNEVNISTEYKDKYQDELFYKFCLLLNSKKRKILELKKQQYYAQQHDFSNSVIAHDNTNIKESKEDNECSDNYSENDMKKIKNIKNKTSQRSIQTCIFKIFYLINVYLILNIIIFK